MKAQSQTIKEILEQYLTISIPLYQRPYCWTSSEVEVLLEDIQNIVNKKKLNDETIQHFIGSFVIEQSSANNKNYLIDGQQRTTTIFLILLAISKLDSENNTNIKQILNRYKLELSEEDSGCYRKCLNGDKLTGKENNLIMQYFFIEKYLDDQDISLWIDAVLNQLYAVNILVENGENVFEIFESLNSKGKALEPFDLIRNFLVMQFKDGEENFYKDYIKPLETLTKDVAKVKRVNGKERREISKESYVNEFIRCYLMLDGKYISKKEIYSEFKENYDNFTDFNSDKSKVHQFLQNLNDYKVFFDNIINPSKIEQSGLREQFERLEMLETETYYPFVLYCYDQFDQRGFDDLLSIFIQILKQLETFIVRTIIGNSSAKKSLDKLFPIIGPKLFSAKDCDYLTELPNILVGNVTKEKSVYIEADEKFAEKIQYFEFYKPSSKFCCLALNLLENDFGNSEKVSADYQQIEHIMPQTFNEAWKNYMGNEWEAIHNKYLNTIGNLTYLAQKENIENSNELFNVKKVNLRKSKFSLNQWFKNIDEWKEEQIIVRGEDLSLRLAKQWHAFEGVKEENLQKSNQNRVTDKKIEYFILNNEKVKLSDTKGSAMMEVFYNYLFNINPNYIQILLDKQQDIVNLGEIKTSKFRSRREIIIKDYPKKIFVGVSSSLDQKLRDIGKSLELLDIPSEKFWLMTDANEKLTVNAPSKRAKKEELLEISYKGIKIEAKDWADAFTQIITMILKDNFDKLDSMPELFTRKTDHGYRALRKCNINGQDVYITTHSSTDEKRRLLKKLCRKFDIDENLVKF